MKLDPEDIRRLARFTLEAKPEELTCDEWLHRVGEYVEANPEEARSKPDLVQVAQHVEKCASCAQELELLRELLRGQGSD